MALYGSGSGYEINLIVLIDGAKEWAAISPPTQFENSNWNETPNIQRDSHPKSEFMLWITAVKTYGPEFGLETYYRKRKKNLFGY